jgi:predicted dehydrogenase
MTGEGRSVGILVLGAGFLGSQRAAAVAATPGARIVGIHDVVPARARDVTSRHGGEVELSLEHALSRSDVDAVIVATPHADHFAQASAALEAGKHAFVEKPLATDPGDARHLALLADERRLRLATGLNHRDYPPVADALALARAGALGKVESVRAEIGHWADRAFLTSWHTDPERSGGGTLMDNGPHACDLIRLLLGEVESAHGTLRRGSDLPENCEVEAYALFRGVERGVAELRSSWTHRTGYLTLEVRGTLGWLRVETAPWRLEGVLSNGRRVRRGYFGDRAGDRLHRLRYGCERSIAREVGAFVASLAVPRSAGAWAHGWDGCQAVEMVEAVYRSARTGAEVRLESPVRHLSSVARRRALAERAT